MKIVSWNCGGAYLEKSEMIAALKPDIAIIKEFEFIDNLIYKNGVVPPKPINWYGNNEHKGISIMSYTGSEFAVDEATPFIEWCSFLRIIGGSVSLKPGPKKQGDPR